MNTGKSVWMGWSLLMVAGAGAYYFAKKDINAHRREQELKGLGGNEFLTCKLPLSLPPSNLRSEERLGSVLDFGRAVLTGG